MPPAGPPSPRPEFFLSAAVTSFRRRFIRAADRPPCHRPVYLLCCRPFFSPPVHPRRRTGPVPAAGTFPLLPPPLLFAAGSSVPPAGSVPAAGIFLLCCRPSFSLPSLLFAAGSSVPLTRPVPTAGVPPPPRRRMALFLPKCPVAKCQSAVPRRDPAILLTIWQRSPIGTTFVCFMASPVKEPAGKMKTNN